MSVSVVVWLHVVSCALGNSGSPDDRGDRATEVNRIE